MARPAASSACASTTTQRGMWAALSVGSGWCSLQACVGCSGSAQAWPVCRARRSVLPTRASAHGSSSRCAGLKRWPASGCHGPLARKPYCWPAPIPGTKADHTPSPAGWSATRRCSTGAPGSNMQTSTPWASGAQTEKCTPPSPCWWQGCAPSAGEPQGTVMPVLAGATTQRAVAASRRPTSAGRAVPDRRPARGRGCPRCCRRSTGRRS